MIIVIIIDIISSCICCRSTDNELNTDHECYVFNLLYFYITCPFIFCQSIL